MRRNLVSKVFQTICSECFEICFMKKNKFLIILGFIFLFGFLLRFLYIYPDNIIFGFDQVMDATNAGRIVVNHDLIVRTLTPNSLGLNHGVLFSYFMAIPSFLGSQNPMVIAYWYLFFNCVAVGSVFVVSLLLFKNWFIAVSSSLLMAVSFQMVLVSGWISNTTVSLFLIPLLLLFLWLYKKGRNWGLILSSLLFGLLIQSQMLMVYYLLTVPFVWFIYKFKWPSLKTILLSITAFLLSISTMIVAEFKSNFSTVRIFLKPSGSLNEASLPFFRSITMLMKNLLLNFQKNLLPQSEFIGTALGIIVLFVVIYVVIRKKTIKEEKQNLLVLLLFFFSPAFTLIVGYHDTPWTLMGTIPLVFILTGYAITKVKSLPIKIIIVGLIVVANLTMIGCGHKKGELFINQETSSTLKGQLAVIDYTYQEAKGQSFAINSVAYPLYTNTYWSYHYPWYGFKKYGYLPNWSGGEQLYPFDRLPRSDGKEQVYFMIIDDTKAIQLWDKATGAIWGQQFGKLVEEKSIGGFTVQKFVKLSKITI
jgi:hypothetical protein